MFFYMLQSKKFNFMFSLRTPRSLANMSWSVRWFAAASILEYMSLPSALALIDD